ncbi:MULTISPECIES: helix-turn-helix domain-containing protein [Acinetobacter]|uniref:helix-turn-helix domain-containing protein n=1 Tax=Acinetobacter TaxID=469 RepID=UPI000235E65B|nr:MULTISPECIES: XRE family transcriptional regulator [Acinetobacter]KXZ63330.1 HTH-type transcriptional regulator PuuR [Acinetobacter venetianus]GAB01145.1 putative Xre family DNA binding protein [Acinetobacter sp. NBRC 100985]
MSQSEAILQYVGENIRFFRDQSQLSQQELADRAGLSRRTIAALEAGQVNISLAKLDAIANALGVDFKRLVSAPEFADSAVVNTIAWQGEQLESQAVLHAAVPARAQVELWTWSLAEGETYVAEPDQQGWQELIYVIEGELSLELESGTQVISTGSSILFESSTHYRYCNQGKGTLKFVRNVIY